jgi:diaminopimelate epimerase
MHGCGNDFVVLDFREMKMTFEFCSLARTMLDRHFGVGGDQLLVVCDATGPTVVCRMRIFNRDGREAEMCG